MQNKVAVGKPADYGQLILKRRAQLTLECVDLTGKRIIDFGCGNGAQTIEFASLDASITALDINQSSLKILSDYLINNKIKNIDPRQYDGESIPLDDNSVDIVLSYEVLEHVGDEDRSMAEIHRVLRDGGEIVFSVPNKWWIFETHGAYLPLLPWNRVPFFSWLPKIIHQRYSKARIYTKGDMRRLLGKHGFSIKQQVYITAPMDVVKNATVQGFLRKYIFKSNTTAVPFLSTAILIHATKQ